MRWVKREGKTKGYKANIKWVAGNGILRGISGGVSSYASLAVHCPLLGLEKEDGAVSEVEIDKVLGLCRGISIN